MNVVYQKYRDSSEEPTSFLMSVSDEMSNQLNDPTERTEEFVIRTHREHAIASLRTKMTAEHKKKEKNNAKTNVEKSFLNRDLNEYRVLLKKKKHTE